METKTQKQKLPYGWKEHVSKNFPDRIYFYNSITKVSCWHLHELLHLEEKSKDSSSNRNSQKRKLAAHSSNKSKIQRTHDNLSSSGYETYSATTPLSEVMELSVMEPPDSDIMMEIDDLRQNFKYNFDDLNSDDLKKFSSIKEVDIYQPLGVQVLYVIIDTNILLTALKLLENLVLLTDDNFQVILIIPWIVLQELDKLKDDKRLKTNIEIAKQARAAIRYLHVQLADTKSSIQGQSLEQATKITSFMASTNDDHILLCCMDFKKKVNASAIILTNDKNLCNKASSNNCSAYTSDIVYQKIKEYTKEPHIESHVINKNCDEEFKTERTVVEIYNSLKLILFDTFSCVLKTCLSLVFGEDKWETVVKIKPPWTLIDIFHCIDRHWVALFGHIFKKRHKQDFTELTNFFKSDKGRSETFQNIQMLIDISTQLCHHLQNTDLSTALTETTKAPFMYSNQISIAIKKLDCLRADCKQFTKENQIEQHNVKQVKFSVHADARNAECIKEVFHDIGCRIRKACTVIAYNLGLPGYEMDCSPVILSKNIVTNQLIHINLLVEDLYRKLINVTQTPIGKLSNKNVEGLLEALKAFYNPENENSLIEEFSSDILHRFCNKEENMENLNRGLCDIYEYGKFLLKCSQSLDAIEKPK